MMPRTLLPALVGALCLCLGSCSSYTPVTVSDNFAYLYGKGSAAMRLQARVYHPTSERSVVYFKLHTRDLLYKSAGGGGPFRSQVMVTYEAYASLGAKILLDSASTYVRDQCGDPNEDKELIGSMEMKRNDKRSFVIRVTAHDVNRDTESTVMVAVNKDQPGGRQDYLPLSLKGVPLFEDQFPPNTTIKVVSEQHAGTTLFGAHYQRSTKLPAPVFSEVPLPALEQTPDSTFSITVPPEGTFTFTTGANGYYHLRTDTTQASGYTLFVLTESYPQIRTGEDMVPPLRYITSLQEWDRITAAKDRRKEVERFWSDASGERNRARDAIAVYYERVESANRHFTSYLEGWKSDRGLVHIIFGTPNTIRKSDQGETWVYGDETNLMSLTFTFVKRNESFSDNDLVLQRDPRFKSAWYRNVESWRNGRILQN